MMNTKDVAGFIAPLAKHARALWAVTIPGEKNALPAEVIADAAGSVGLPAQTADSVLAAIRDIPVHAGNGRVLICGSLYFAGKVLAENG
jgi:dihydrofolate synthase/folylpolyglutamate synthase